ncbi:hypothetical protein BaRGS_00022967, partial [Batillaria attramentaria]
ILVPIVFLAWGTEAVFQTRATEKWVGGFKAEMDVPICKDLDGFRMHLNFTQDVERLMQWAGEATKVSDREWLIESPGAHLQSGTTYNVVLVAFAKYNEMMDPVINVDIEGMPDCGGTGTSTTSPTSSQ